MEPRIIEIKTAGSAQQSKQAQRGASFMAGPTIWYALAGLSIIFSLYLFLFATTGSESLRHDVAIFIGLWAPMFGILGLRAEVLEMRGDMERKRR